MRIRMLVQKTGLRWDGQDWPDRGGEIDVPDDEATALIGQGDAIPVTQDDVEVPDQAAVADVEIRSGQKPIVNSPKAAWVEHAVAQGMDRGEAEAMKKTDLIARYGSGG